MNLLIKKNMLIFGILFFFFGGCAMHAEERCDYEDYVHEIINDFKKEAYEKFGLICIGRGGRMPYDVESIRVTFIIYAKGTIEKGRYLEVEAIEMLLKKINAHKKIRPFLKVYPFTSERAEVSISFRKDDNDSYKDGSIVYIDQVRNKIYYACEDGISPVYKTVAEELYEEARKIVLGSEGSRHEDF